MNGFLDEQRINELPLSASQQQVQIPVLDPGWTVLQGNKTALPMSVFVLGLQWETPLSEGSSTGSPRTLVK